MTVLIIGGAFQGKRKIAEKLYPELPKVFNLHEIVRKCIAKRAGPAGTFCSAARPCDNMR